MHQHSSHHCNMCSSRRNCSRLQFTDTQPDRAFEKHHFSVHFMRAFTSPGLQTSTDKLKSLSVPGTSLLHQCWPQPAVSGSRAKHGCLTTGFALNECWMGDSYNRYEYPKGGVKICVPISHVCHQSSEPEHSSRYKKKCKRLQKRKETSSCNSSKMDIGPKIAQQYFNEWKELPLGRNPTTLIQQNCS